MRVPAYRILSGVGESSEPAHLWFSKKMIVATEENRYIIFFILSHSTKKRS